MSSDGAGRLTRAVNTGRCVADLRLDIKRAIKSALKTAAHLQRVTTLPSLIKP